ncbi:hypothetical protein BH11PSE7_BH11PSE7_31480 [soil metagenome]
MARFGNGRLALPPEHPGFAEYLYWFHFANGNLQPHLGRNMVLGRIEAAPPARRCRRPRRPASLRVF